jgi:uncharacterized membrane protein YdjX (TVP38/TMEM64 family)
MNDARAARLVQALALAPLIAGVAVYALHAPSRAALDAGVSALARGDLAALRAWGTELGAWAMLGTTVLMVVQALAAPIPAVFVTWTNSWLFGPLAGGAISIVQATLAALICFALARAFGEPLVARLLPFDALKRAEAFMLEHGARAVLIARLMPVVPFDPISYVAGLSRMRAGAFAWATLVGQVPAGMAYAYLGHEITRPARLVVAGACVVLALLALALAVRSALKRDPVRH